MWECGNVVGMLEYWNVGMWECLNVGMLGGENVRMLELEQAVNRQPGNRLGNSQSIHNSF